MSLVLSEIPVLYNIELPEPITIAFIVIFIVIGAVGACILRVDEGMLHSMENIRMLKSALEEISVNHASSISGLIQRVAELEGKLEDQRSEVTRLENKKLVRMNTRITKFVAKFEADMQKVKHNMSLFENEFDDFTEFREYLEDEMGKTAGKIEYLEQFQNNTKQMIQTELDDFIELQLHLKREMGKITHLEQFQNNTQQMIQIIDEKVGNMMSNFVQSDARYANRFALIEDDISKTADHQFSLIERALSKIESLRTELESHKQVFVCLHKILETPNTTPSMGQTPRVLGHIFSKNYISAYDKKVATLHEKYMGAMFNIFEVNKILLCDERSPASTEINRTTKKAYDCMMSVCPREIEIVCNNCDKGRAGNPCDCVANFKKVD